MEDGMNDYCYKCRYVLHVLLHVLLLQMLASASGSFGISSSQICLWSLEDMYCAKVLVHHEFDVVCMAYSRDDRFLVSVGGSLLLCVMCQRSSV